MAGDESVKTFASFPPLGRFSGFGVGMMDLAWIGVG